MMLVLASSSLHHAFGILTAEEKITLKEQVYSIASLRLNTNTNNSKKINQIMLNIELKDKKNVVVWHDLLNFNFYKQKSNGFQSQPVHEILVTLKSIENTLRALFVLPALSNAGHQRRIENTEYYCLAC